jgi:hypothetical protein
MENYGRKCNISVAQDVDGMASMRAVINAAAAARL